jgi:hypothetical protein
MMQIAYRKKHRIIPAMRGNTGQKIELKAVMPGFQLRLGAVASGGSFFEMMPA